MLSSLLFTALLAPLQDCSQLTNGFGAYGVAWGPNGGDVYASAVHDDGSGTALYLGGDFAFAGETLARSIVRFDGTGFEPLPGPGGAHVVSASGFGVRALASFDDGSGPALYVGGDFDVSLGLPQHGIAKWDGTTWTPVLSVTSQFSGFVGVVDMLVWNDGTGPALYFVGTFDKINGVAAASIGKYDGSGWSTVGAGYAGSYATSLAVHDDGSGEKLFVAGWNFPSKQSVESWDGASWTILPGVFDSPVGSLHSHDDGTGAALYAGGTFATPFQSIARWDGGAWSAVGSGVQFFPTAFATHDDGGGSELYAIGYSYVIPPPAWAIRAARWDGTGWEYLQSGLSADGWTLCEFDAGTGAELYAGGTFTQAGGKRADHVAKWTASGWSRIYSSKGLRSTGEALFAFDDGGGSELYGNAGLLYLNVQGEPNVDAVVRWTGTSWSSVPGTFAGPVWAFGAFDAGSGEQLHAAGAFTEIDGTTVDGVARFDGTAWHALAGGVSQNGSPGFVAALCLHDFGAGPRLVAGGNFDAAGGVSARNIAVWDGASWSALDVGISGTVYALASYDAGSGAKLYAGGDFVNASGTLVNNITRWNGTTWEALGAGTNREVFALTVADLGGGPKLYVGGEFFVADAIVAPYIAAFDGTSWQALLSGGLALDDRVSTIVTHDEGEGPQLYVGGQFKHAGGAPANYVARWTGTAWLALDEEPDGAVHALASFDEGVGIGPALFANGFFGTWNGTPSMGTARIAPVAPCAPVVYCTSKPNSLGCAPTMYTTGSTSLALNNFRLHAGNVLNNKNGLLFWSTRPNGVAFQGGHLCCKPPIVRTPVQTSAGNPPPNDCSGSLHFHWNQMYVSSLSLPLGDWYYTQYWSRDPNSPSTTSLSDAIRFLLTP